MFTGIVEEIGTVKSVKRQQHSMRLVITSQRVIDGLKAGESVCTNGVCLTVTAVLSDGFEADVMPETFRRSALSTVASGDRVNLERALQLSGRLGGHIVNGHIDGTGTISRIRNEENAVWITITADSGIMRYIVGKGSVAVEGISLTVAKVNDHSFDVSLIPLTQQETTLPGKKAGDVVNIECDILGKYTEKMMKKEKGNITPEFLQEMGF
jgi:riboflavin synthase